MEEEVQGEDMSQSICGLCCYETIISGMMTSNVNFGVLTEISEPQNK